MDNLIVELERCNKLRQKTPGNAQVATELFNIQRQIVMPECCLRQTAELEKSLKMQCVRFNRLPAVIPVLQVADIPA
ncbi:MAG: hypothetical protein BWY20_02043 [Spirochaetes bacterium ADurb.Bin215]|nr:MAG: hypothetical protein BWY20_02043 [Spirochaetes bacterium ADurb.Bin215]